MAQAETHTETRQVVTGVTLRLDKDEALALRNLVQEHTGDSQWDDLYDELTRAVGDLVSGRESRSLQVGDKVRMTLADASNEARARRLHGVVGELVEIDQGPDNEGLPYQVRTGNNRIAYVHAVERI